MYFTHFIPQIMASYRSWIEIPKDLQEILHKLQGGNIKHDEVGPVLTEAMTRIQIFVQSA